MVAQVQIYPPPIQSEVVTTPVMQALSRFAIGQAAIPRADLQKMRKIPLFFVFFFAKPAQNARMKGSFEGHKRTLSQGNCGGVSFFYSFNFWGKSVSSRLYWPTSLLALPPHCSYRKLPPCSKVTNAPNDGEVRVRRRRGRKKLHAQKVPNCPKSGAPKLRQLLPH